MITSYPDCLLADRFDTGRLRWESSTPEAWPAWAVVPAVGTTINQFHDSLGRTLSHGFIYSSGILPRDFRWTKGPLGDAVTLLRNTISMPTCLVPGVPSVPDKNWTVDLVCQLTSSTAQTKLQLLVADNSTAIDSALWFKVENDTVSLMVDAEGGPLIECPISVSGFNRTDWHRYTLSYNGLTYRAWLDGQPIASGQTATSRRFAWSTVNGLLGQNQLFTAGTSFFGQFAYLGVYSRVLDRLPTDPIGWLKSARRPARSVRLLELAGDLASTVEADGWIRKWPQSLAVEAAQIRSGSTAAGSCFQTGALATEVRVSSPEAPS